jgi:hypothetical protein
MNGEVRSKEVKIFDRQCSIFNREKGKLEEVYRVAVVFYINDNLGTITTFFSPNNQ